MERKIRLIQKKRFYSEEFKRYIVNEFESGRLTVGQLVRLHKVSEATIYNWIYKLSTVNEKGIRIVELKDSSAKKMQDLERKIAELERALGQKQIKIDYLEKMIDLAKDELKIDIKKNFNTPQSAGSEKTKHN